MFKYFTKCLSNYANLKGRARRKEFWSFILISGILQGLFVSIYSNIFGFGESGLEKLAKFIFFVPTLAVAVRRLHDIGRSGWWLIIFPTGIGTIILFFMMCTEGDRYDNEYGPDPKRFDPQDRHGCRNRQKWRKKGKGRKRRYRSDDDLYV